MGHCSSLYLIRKQSGEMCPSASRLYRGVALSNDYGLDVIITSILSDGSTVDTAVHGGRVLCVSEGLSALITILLMAAEQYSYKRSKNKTFSGLLSTLSAKQHCYVCGGVHCALFTMAQVSVGIKKGAPWYIAMVTIEQM